MSYLELKNVSKTFSTVAAVKDFTLSIEKGKLVSFLGPSGCGKTTTLRMVAGFEQPDSGTIMLDGQDITIVPPNRRDIGMVFQAYALFPNKTVQENVAFGLKMKRVPESRERPAGARSARHGPAGRGRQTLPAPALGRAAAARRAGARPGGPAADVAAGRAALGAGRGSARGVAGEIRRIQSDLAITTVYVTHDQEEALSISDMVVVMNAGVIEQVGTAVEIYRKPQTRFVATFIGTANQFLGQAVAETGCPMRSFPAGDQAVQEHRPRRERWWCWCAPNRSRCRPARSKSRAGIPSPARSRRSPSMAPSPGWV